VKSEQPLGRLPDEDGTSKVQEQMEEDASNSLQIVSLAIREHLLRDIQSPAGVSGRRFTKVSTNDQDKVPATRIFHSLSTTTAAARHIMNTIERRGYFLPEGRQGQVCNFGMIDADNIPEWNLTRHVFAKSFEFFRVFSWTSEELMKERRHFDKREIRRNGPERACQCDRSEVRR
jgi:hypothetical protein